MANRVVGLIAIGVDDPGVVSRLKGAASGASRIANWLETQRHLGVDPIFEVLTDAAGAKVGYREVRDAAIRLTEHSLDLLIVYLAGHGFVRSGGSEFVLLSQFPKYQEAIDVAATASNAKRLSIPHVVVITDACRSSADAFGPAGEINGSPVFRGGPTIGVSPGKVDVFFATEPSQTAKEYKGEGFFTKILVEALELAPAEVREAWPGRPDVIPAWRMEEYLGKTVPVRAFAHDPSFEQTPDFQVTSRPPLFLAYVPPDDTVEVGLTEALDPSRVLDLSSRSKSTFSRPSDAAHYAEGDRRREALARVVSLTRSSGMPVPSDLLSQAGLLERVTSYRGVGGARMRYESRTGYTIFGTQIEGVMIDPQLKAEILLGDGGLVDLRLSGDLWKAKSASVLVRLQNGTTCVLPFLAGYVGAVDLTAGQASTIAFAINQHDASRFNSSEADEEAAREQKAIAAALASTGQLWWLARDDAAEYAAFVRQNKQLDPSLGIYASYAYAMAGRESDARSVYNWFVKYQHSPFPGHLVAPIIFDVGMLGGALFDRSPMQRLPLAPFCPMMGAGWSMLESYGADDVHDALALAGRVRLSSEWTLFPTDKIQPLFDAFERGEIA